MAVTAAILGGLLGAGGQIAGGAISGNSAKTRSSIKEKQIVGSDVNPLANPVVAALAADALARMGVVDPGLLAGTSPLEQTIASLNAATTSNRTRDRAVAMLQGLQRSLSEGVLTLEDLDALASGEIQRIPGFGAFGMPLGNRPDAHLFGGVKFNKEHLGFLDRLVANTPFGSLRELFQAEERFQRERVERERRLGTLAEQSRQRQDAINAALVGLTSQATGLADFEGIMSTARESILRDIDREQSAALARANAGGYNPGAALEALTDARLDVPLRAFDVAAQQTVGQQTILSNAANLLSLLDPSNAARGIGPSGLLPASNFVAQGGGGAGSGAAGAGLAAGATTLGNTIQSIPLLQSLLKGRNQAPTTVGSTAPAATTFTTGTFSPELLAEFGLQ